MTAPLVLDAALPDAVARIVESALLANTASGCERPIHLTGRQHTVDATTGEILATLASGDLPGGVLSVACKTRRAARCEPCSTLYKFDAYQVAAAGLRGGKGLPETVAEHPRLWVTLTAPSFGPVHLGPEKGGKARPCHPRREGPSCHRWHRIGDPEIGTPINPDGYDYVGAVLFNHLAGALWSRFTANVRRALARLSGQTQRDFRDLARVSFGKVAEYQTRGVVHFHAVIRLDGPDGPDSPPPAWLTTEILTEAVRSAHVATWLDAPGPDSRRLRWGRQLDIQTIDALGNGEMTDARVAGYIAKYATKGAEDTGTFDERLTCPACRGASCPRCHRTGLRPDLDIASVPDHARRMITTCLALAETSPDLVGLRRWAHMLGFGGHFLTKSRGYSTTFGALRATRADYQATEARERTGLPTTVVLVNHWSYAGQYWPRREASRVAS